MLQSSEPLGLDLGGAVCRQSPSDSWTGFRDSFRRGEILKAPQRKIRLEDSDVGVQALEGEATCADCGEDTCSKEPWSYVVQLEMMSTDLAGQLLTSQSAEEALASEYEALICRHESLTHLLTVLTSQHDTQASHHEALAAEHQALITQHEALTSQHTALTWQHETLTSEHEALTCQHQGLDAQHQSLSCDYDTLTAEHSGMASEHRALVAQEKASAAQEEALTTRLAILASQHEALTSQNETLRSQVEALASQHEAITSQNEALAFQNEILTAQVDALASQNEAHGSKLPLKDASVQVVENARYLHPSRSTLAELLGKLGQVAQVDESFRLLLETHPLRRSESLGLSRVPSLLAPASRQPPLQRQESDIYNHDTPAQIANVPSLDGMSDDDNDRPQRQQLPGIDAWNQQSRMAVEERLPGAERGSPRGSADSRRASRDVRMGAVSFAPVNPLFGQLKTEMEQSADWTPSLEAWHAQKDLQDEAFGFVGSNPTNPLFERGLSELTASGTWLITVRAPRPSACCPWSCLQDGRCAFDSGDRCVTRTERVWRRW